MFFFFFPQIYFCTRKCISANTMFLPKIQHLCHNVATFFQKFAFLQRHLANTFCFHCAVAMRT